MVGLKTPTDAQNIIVLTKMNSLPSIETLAADHMLSCWLKFLFVGDILQGKCHSVSLIIALFSPFKPDILCCMNTSPVTPQSNIL